MLGIACGVGGCREREAPGDRTERARPIVAVTIFPIGDITRAVAGSAAEVIVVLPAGASPATFEPAPDAVRRLAGARLVVAVGAGADDWGRDLADASGAPLLTLTERLTLDYGNNPHVWLDPILVREAILPQLTDALVGLVPGEAASLRMRAAEYRESLTALDRQIRARFSELKSRAFVATHPAWPYFAARYGLQQVGVLYTAPGQEPSPRELAALIDEARRAGVRAVFTEPQLGETGARALAEDLHARIGTLDPLGGPAVAGRSSYEALLRYNAQELAETLDGSNE